MSQETIMPNIGLFERINDLLKSKGVDYRVIEHEPLDGSASGSSTISGTRPEQGAKALVMMAKIGGERKPIMVVLRGPDYADNKAIKLATASKDVRMATPEEVQALTQSEVGVLPPIGSMFGVQTYFDKSLLNEGDIAFGTGMRTRTILMKASDFVQTTNPVLGDFAKK